MADLTTHYLHSCMDRINLKGVSVQEYATGGFIKKQTNSLVIPSASVAPSVSVGTSVKGFTEISGVSISIASPCVVTSAGHGISDHEIIKFTTTGALPTGLTAFTYYYCDYVDIDTFRITSTIGGANINTSGSQSGTQSVWHET